MNEQFNCFDRYVMEECHTNEERISLSTDVNSLWDRLNAYMTPQRQRAYGLAVGRIQSGKTRNYIGLILKAIYCGYNTIIVLTSNNKRLAIQTYDRIYDWVDRKLELNLNSLSMAPDPPEGRVLQWLGQRFSPNRIQVGVIMKNTAWLDRLQRWVERNQANLGNMKLLFIDDESDNGTPNANARQNQAEDAERAEINRRICGIVGSIDGGNKPQYQFGKMIYVGYTATPFASMLNENPTMDPICPDCIKSLRTSSKYFGFQRIFGSPDNQECKMDIVRVIGDDEYDAWITQIQERAVDLNVIDDDLRRNFNFAAEDEAQDIQDVEWLSLKKAIQWAFCTAAARRIQRLNRPEGDEDRDKIKNRWTTMLFHISDGVNGDNAPHDVQQQLVQRYIARVMSKENIDGFIDACRALWAEETQRFNRQAFSQSCNGYGAIDDYPDWDDIERELRGWFLTGNGTHVKVIQMNSKHVANGQPDYWDFNEDIDGDTLWIICGGNAISRGLTLEGLTVSYFVRATTCVDTITQMGRWFGYRPGYELLPRIWMRPDSVRIMKESCKTEELLHASINDVYDGDGGVPPSIRTGEGISAIRYFGMRLTGRDRNQGEVFNASSSFRIFKHVNDINDRGMGVTSAFLDACREEFPVQEGSTRPLNIRHELFWLNVSAERITEYITNLLNTHYLTGVSIYEAEGLLHEIAHSQTGWNVVVGNPVTQRHFGDDAGRFAGLGIRNNVFARGIGMEVQIGTGQLTSGAFLARMPDDVMAHALQNLNNQNVVEGDMRHVKETFRLVAEQGGVDPALLNPTLLIDFTHGDAGTPFVQVSFYWHGHSEGSFVRAMVGPRQPQQADAVDNPGHNENRVLDRIAGWVNRPDQTPYRAISAFLLLTQGDVEGIVTVGELKQRFSNGNQVDADRFKKAWGSLKTNRGNAYGRVFSQDGRGDEALAQIVPEIQEVLHQHPDWFRD